MNIDAYLKRYYTGSRDDSETLRALQVAHLLAVPFLNLSIHAGEPSCLMKSHCLERSSKTGAVGFVMRPTDCSRPAARWVSKWRCCQPASQSRWRFRTGLRSHDPDGHACRALLVDVGFGDSAKFIMDFARRAGAGNALVSHRRRHQSAILQRHDNGGDWVPSYRSATPHSPITNRCATSTRPLPNPTSPKPLSAPSQPRTAASPDRPAPNHHLRPTTPKTRSRTATRSTTSSAINSAS